MNELLTYLFAGIALGATFALIGSGFVVVHRVTGIVNFTQGTYAVVGGMTASTLLDAALPHGLAELLAVAVSAGAGLLVGWITIGIRPTNPGNALVITLGLSVLAYAVLILIWGDAPRSSAGIAGSVEIAGVSIQAQYLLVVAVTAVTFAALGLFFGRSYLGKALTASASNPFAARMVGINVRRMGLISFVIAGALGGVAGVLVTPLRSLAYDSDIVFILSGFAAAVFGGLQSPLKTVVGGLVLGIAGMLFAGYFASQFQTEVALAAMLIVMILRGRRLVGEEKL